MGYTKQSITDHLGRTFKKLRLSLTSHCNLGCVYCVAPGQKSKSVSGFIPPQELALRVEKIHQVTELSEVRLTGGEPTLYKQLPELIRLLQNIGIPKVRMTSNGYLLFPLLEDLVKAGLSDINISLDAIEQEAFLRITRRSNLSGILKAVLKASALQMNVKLNTVVMRGLNDDQIVPLYLFAKHHQIPIRFLELMKMGHLNGQSFQPYFYSQQQILDTLSEVSTLTAQSRKAGATATYWKDQDDYEVGIIANESAPFCTDCDRLRMDSEGNLFGCLSSKVSFNISPVVNDPVALSHLLKQALYTKQEEKFTGSTLSMLRIGG